MDTKDFTITTVYFDGQFWCALIERHLQDKCFVGRHVFGEKPSNPKLLEWMLNDFSQVKLFPVNQTEFPKIRMKKITGKNCSDSKNTKNQIPKSLKAFSAAQKEFFAQKKNPPAANKIARKNKSNGSKNTRRKNCGSKNFILLPLPPF